MQVAALLQLAVQTVPNRNPEEKRAIIHSDMELIIFIFNIKTRTCAEKKVVLIIWIFTEAQTGKILLDTHYSYLN